MSQSAPVAPPPAPAATADGGLAALRAELDRVDDALHDLLVQRAGVVERLAALRAKGASPLRPGREASILRRLLRRHTGGLPAQALVRIWRELFAATTAMQGGFTVAVCEAEPGGTFVQCAREQFGALTPLHTHRSPAHAIGEVSAGAATVAVLPMPSETETPAQAWWTALLQRDEPRIHIVARLPFWAARPDGAPRAQALVVATVPPDPTGHDRTLIGLEIGLEVSRARLAGDLAAAGFTPGQIILRRDPGDTLAYALAELDGHIADGDPRLATLASARHPPVVLGGYAIPWDGGQA